MHYRTISELNINLGSRVSCICGKDVSANHYFANTTENMDEVNCPFCFALLKNDNWYCLSHGFIGDEQITHEETCVQCGRSVL